MKPSLHLLVCLLYCIYSNAYAQPNRKTGNESGVLKIVFINQVNNKPVVLYDSSYTNSFGESYTLTKLKYYVSHTELYSKSKINRIPNDYHLIDQAADSSLYFTVAVPQNQFDSIRFLLGVDSAMNTSGAQTGALDPMNDMFWTWNSGYVMQKLEGSSPQSKIVNNKIEYHIGGFSGPNSVLNYLYFSFPENNPLIIKKGKTTTIIINMNVDGFWNAVTNIRITDTPVCTQPGAFAKQVAFNFSKLFTIAKIINEQ